MGKKAYRVVKTHYQTLSIIHDIPAGLVILKKNSRYYGRSKLTEPPIRRKYSHRRVDLAILISSPRYTYIYYHPDTEAYYYSLRQVSLIEGKTITVIRRRYLGFKAQNLKPRLGWFRKCIEDYTYVEISKLNIDFDSPVVLE
jgi:hypothetical protein